MLADRRFKNVWDLIEGVSPTDIKNSKGMPLLEGLHARGHIKRHGTVGYGTRGHMGVAAIIPSGINSIMARLQDIGISPDVLNTFKATSIGKSLGDNIDFLAPGSGIQPTLENFTLSGELTKAYTQAVSQ
jgi:hypothetical protein